MIRRFLIEDTWEDNLLYSPFDAGDDEEVKEDIDVPDIEPMKPTVTLSMIKSQWYALKSSILEKNCPHLMQLIEKMDVALFSDTHEKKKQCTMPDFFKSYQSLTRKRPRIEPVVVDDDSEVDNVSNEGSECVISIENEESIDNNDK